jgi:hypothetical protein
VTLHFAGRIAQLRDALAVDRQCRGAGRGSIQRNRQSICRV